MAEAARLPLPYPEAAVVDEDSLAEQNLALACDLPAAAARPRRLLLRPRRRRRGAGGAHDRLAVVWFDAHGDLNTPESSPSGNPWGMPLRMLLDAGAVDPADVVLVGARNLDPPEGEFIAASGLRTGAERLDRALEGTDGVYVAFDVDVARPGTRSARSCRSPAA